MGNRETCHKNNENNATSVLNADDLMFANNISSNEIPDPKVILQERGVDNHICVSHYSSESVLLENATKKEPLCTPHFSANAEVNKVSSPDDLYIANDFDSTISCSLANANIVFNEQQKNAITPNAYCHDLNTVVCKSKTESARISGSCNLLKNTEEVESSIESNYLNCTNKIFQNIQGDTTDISSKNEISRGIEQGNVSRDLNQLMNALTLDNTSLEFVTNDTTNNSNENIQEFQIESAKEKDSALLFGNKHITNEENDSAIYTILSTATIYKDDFCSATQTSCLKSQSIEDLSTISIDHSNLNPEIYEKIKDSAQNQVTIGSLVTPNEKNDLINQCDSYINVDINSTSNEHFINQNSIIPNSEKCSTFRSCGKNSIIYDNFIPQCDMTNQVHFLPSSVGSYFEVKLEAIENKLDLAVLTPIDSDVTEIDSDLPDISEEHNVNNDDDALFKVNDNVNCEPIIDFQISPHVTLMMPLIEGKKCDTNADFEQLSRNIDPYLKDTCFCFDNIISQTAVDSENLDCETSKKFLNNQSCLINEKSNFVLLDRSHFKKKCVLHGNELKISQINQNQEIQGVIKLKGCETNNYHEDDITSNSSNCKDAETTSSFMIMNEMNMPRHATKNVFNEQQLGIKVTSMCMSNEKENMYKESIMLKNYYEKDSFDEKKIGMLLNEIYDGTVISISELISDTYERMSTQEKELIALTDCHQNIIKEKDQALEDVQNVEKAFSDLMRRYEYLKSNLGQLKENEPVLKREVYNISAKIAEETKKYDILQVHVDEKLNQANEEINQTKREKDTEKAALTAMLRKLELKIKSLTVNLDQITNDNTELSRMCEELSRH